MVIKLIALEKPTSTIHSLFAESVSLGTDASFEIGTSVLVLRNWLRLRGNPSRGMVKKVARGLSPSPPHDQDRAASVHEFIMFIPTFLLVRHCTWPVYVKCRGVFFIFLKFNQSSFF